ncbi:MAG: ComEC/Rec2 family competence protein [Bacteroidales bacterium]|nr:ComEC/Rec2 family competence protein [Bacteroidales bacterium]
MLLFLALGMFCGILPTGPGLFDVFSTAGGTMPAGGLFGESSALYPSGVGMSVFERALGRTIALVRSLPFAHEKTGALLQALLTGSKEALSRDTIVAFRTAGASHILALSGLHLGVIYLLLGRVMSVFGNVPVMMAARSAVIVSVCAFYAIMTGASPSIVRALLFIGINELMRFFPDRCKTPISVWCCALMIQLCLSPEVIRSVGFQLSYLAMLGIFTLFPVLDGWYDASPGNGKSPWKAMDAVNTVPVRQGKDRKRTTGPMRWIWSSMALSISCQLFTAPLVWVVFGTFPRYFLLTNLLALPLVSALMPFAIVSATLFALGLCPDVLLDLTDFFATLLLSVISIIAEL